MNGLLIGLAAFVGTHFLMSHPLRAPLVARLGTGPFQGLYSLVSLATFYLVYTGYRDAPRGAPVWPVGDLLWWIASLIMLFGAILLAGSFFGNPALPQPGAAALAKQPARGVFAITRHPMMWGIALWALVHAMVAPHLASLLLTGGIALLALGGSYGQDHKKAVLMGEGWQDWASRTSFLPFARQLRGKARWGSAWPGRRPLLIGLLIWLVATYLHPLLGGPVAGIWRWLW